MLVVGVKLGFGFVWDGDEVVDHLCRVVVGSI